MIDEDPRPRSRTRRQRVLLATVPPVTATLLRLLHATLRYEDVFQPGANAATKADHGIWCFWHNCLLPSACFFGHWGAPITLLISSSFDGELIARTIERMGFLTVRGSSSRGGAAGLRALAGSLAAASAVVFPADGPRGPQYGLKPGVIKLAQLTGETIRPFYLRPRRAWRLRSWDRFLIPVPFTRVAVSWGAAISVPRELDRDEFERTRQQVEAALEDVRRRAEEHFRLRT